MEYYVFSALLFTLIILDIEAQWRPPPHHRGRGQGRNDGCPPHDPLCLGPAGWGRRGSPNQGAGGNGQGRGGGPRGERGGGQGGGFGGQGGGWGGPGGNGQGGRGGRRGGGGKVRREPSYYINKYAVKQGDVLIAKNGNGQRCRERQTRTPSAVGLDRMVSVAYEAAQQGRCTRMGGGNGRGGRGGPPPRFGGFEDGNSQGFSGFGSTGSQGRWGGFPKRFKRQGPMGFGRCGESSSSSTCDSGNIRVESLYSEQMHGQYRLVVANGIPKHCYQTQQIHANPNVACESFQYIYAPARVEVRPQSIRYKDTPMGPVGIAVSGAYLYNHKSAESCNVAAIQEKESFDSCDGHADPSCRYHYHKAPICITKWNNCGLMGYLMDGIPVYGECTISTRNGPTRLKSCYHLKAGSLGCDADADFEWRDERSSNGCHLDAANGRYFAERTSTGNAAVTFEAGDYAYFVTPEYPFLMPKYVGENRMCGLTP